MKSRNRFSAKFFLLLAFPILFVVSCHKQGVVDTSRPVEYRFYSQARGRTIPGYILFPRDYNNTKKSYPVLYLLHGAYGSYHDWVEKTNLFQLSRKYSLMIVTPDGDSFGWYLDSPFVDSSQIETYLIYELIPYVDRKYRTLSDREGRGICGLSMGGHGAFILAAHHPDMFYSISSLSGVMDIARHKSQWHLPDILPVDNDSLWKFYSVLSNSGKFRFPDISGSFGILFDVGRDDFTFAENMAMHDALDSLGVEHMFKVYPGNHSWQYWQEHIDEHLKFHSVSLQQPE